MFGRKLLHILALAAPCSSSGASPPGPSGAHGPKTFYRVKPYDTLWTIARSHYGGDVRGRVWQIQHANHLPGSEIAPGRAARPAVEALEGPGATIAPMDLDVVFLGTSASAPTARRGTSSLLVRRGGDRLLFDCGEGTQRQLLRSSIGLVDLEDVFLTPSPRRPLPRPARDAQDVLAADAGARAHGLRPAGPPRALRRARARDREADLRARARRAARRRRRRPRRLPGLRLPGAPRRARGRLRARRGRSGPAASTTPRPTRSASRSGRSGGRSSAASRSRSPTGASSRPEELVGAAEAGPDGRLHRRHRARPMPSRCSSPAPTC